ncbi:hypothetical protein EGW08_011938 [Elysia chlorotica]|uniref:BZIP domain-containing protein n=1 Tax=Elysia chlorotica TaxID=188477 RepID=A0A3S1BCG4_ELYCH|nr:hypothetical protein EGW08_011938 [Elysia chlorotica]
MPKEERPFKKYRLEASHDFKRFDSDNKRRARLYPDSSVDARHRAARLSGGSQALQASSSSSVMSGPSGLMQHHHHQQQRHRQLSHPQQQQQPRVSNIGDQQQQRQVAGMSGPMGQHQQVYGDPGDYLRLAAGQASGGMSGMTSVGSASSLLGLDPSLGVGPPYNYDDLDLSDPETTNALLMRNDLMVTSDSLIHQREQDLNLVSSTPPAMASSSSSMPVPAFMVPNRSVLAARSQLLGGHDPLAMLFDHPALPQPSSYSSGVDNTSSTFTPSSGGLLSHTSASSSNFLMGAGGNGSSFGSSGGIGPGSTPLNGNGRSGGSSNGGGRRPQPQQQQPPPNATAHHTLPSNSSFLVKQEADEGHFVDDEESLSRSSLNSPPKKADSSHDSRAYPAPSGSDDRKRGMKRTLSNCSAASSTGGGGEGGGDGCTSKTSPSSQTSGGRNGGGGEALSPGTSGDVSKSPPNGSDSLKERDPAYLEKRRKNNESAKRSREARRTKEELVAFKVINLEEENMKLRAEIRLLDKELDELRTRLYQCN